jgi:signal transduction histidine kinase
VFASVTAEVGRLLSADLLGVSRYEPDGAHTIVGAWTGSDAALPVPGRTRLSHGGRNVTSLVFETGRPARIDDYADGSGPATDLARELGVRTSVGVPISVEGRLWGVIIVASASEQPLAADTEDRLAGFTELVGTAIANAQARVELRGYAEEQAALRRVATLVARGAPPEEVFAAVAAEAGRLLGAGLTTVGRYEPDDTVTILGAWSTAGAALPLSVGTPLNLGGQNASTLVSRTGRPARIGDYGQATGALADVGREWGLRTAAGAPITVEGRLWGILSIGSTEELLLADTEARLVGFAELAATAIANAEARAALAASRARIVAAADEARRRIERDLHDGAQQQLVTLALQLRKAQEMAPPGSAELAKRLDGVAAGLDAALEELREIAHGIHPAVLATGGLRPALRALARRCPVPVDLHVQVAGRPPDQVEIAAYYVVCEALANTAKHAHASVAQVEVADDDRVLRACVRDDGRGGADFRHGSGLVGLKDRVEALGGRISLHSPLGEGTTLAVDIPVS